MGIIFETTNPDRKTGKRIGDNPNPRGTPSKALAPRPAGRADTPDYAAPAAARVASGEFERGVLVCGTGFGMEIAANKVAGVRAVTPYDDLTARMSREHNDSNVACFGERTMPADRAIHLLDIWLKTAFEGGRHQERLDKIRRIEESPPRAPAGRPSPPGGSSSPGRSPAAD